jgi:hypothetical protein
MLLQAGRKLWGYYFGLWLEQKRKPEYARHLEKAFEVLHDFDEPVAHLISSYFLYRVNMFNVISASLPFPRLRWVAGFFDGRPASTPGSEDRSELVPCEIAISDCDGAVFDSVDALSRDIHKARMPRHNTGSSGKRRRQKAVHGGDVCSVLDRMLTQHSAMADDPFLWKRPPPQLSCNPLPFTIKPIPQARLHPNPARKLESVGMLKFVFQKRCASAYCPNLRPEGGRVPPRWLCASSLICSPLTGTTAFRRPNGEYLVFVEEHKAKVVMYRWSSENQ